MPYYDYLGREIEDAEADNMRRDRAEAEQDRLADETQPAGKCPACGKVYTVSDVEWEGERSPYLPCHPVRWQDLIDLAAELDASLLEDEQGEA